MTRIQSRKHLDFIRSLPCLACGDNTSIEAAHVRMADARVPKAETGMGRKPDDWWTVPLCSSCHRKQHDIGEAKFWWCVDPIIKAMALFCHSGDYAIGCRIVER